MGKNTLNVSQSARVFRLIEDHCKKGDNGLAQYHAGWSDERVATEAGVALKAVQYRRRELVGRTVKEAVRAPAQSQDVKAALELIAELDGKHRELMRRVTDLETNYKPMMKLNSELSERVDHLQRIIAANNLNVLLIPNDNSIAKHAKNTSALNPT